MRVMNWNIEALSNAKLSVPGMPAAIARTVAAANVDILIVLEVKMTRVANAMTTLSNALNVADGGGNNWRGYFLSRRTGGEYYCVFVRNLDLVRPVFPQAGVGPSGATGDPLRNLKQNVFEAWPSANWAATAYPFGGPAAPPLPPIPLCDLYATRPRARAAQRANFGGQTVGNGGYSLGRGFRMPALALFWAHTAAGNDYLLPFVMCHYAAMRGRRARNILAQSQVYQLMYLHIAQLFNSNATGAGTSGYLDVLNAAGGNTAVRVQEVCFTGDFNLDFLENNAGGATHLARTNRGAYDGLTATQQQGGSTGPGAPTALPGAAGPVPALPYGPPWPAAPSASIIYQQRLRAAVTTQGTIQQTFPLPAPLPVIPPAPYGSAAFDNFFYGGTQMSGALPLVGLDAGQAIDVPASIVQGAPAAANQINLATVAANYAVRARPKNANNAPSLRAAGPPPALTADDRLIGSRLVSDHLPVLLDFALP